jgi:hypothetical protein
LYCKYFTSSLDNMAKSSLGEEMLTLQSAQYEDPCP